MKPQLGAYCTQCYNAKIHLVRGHEVTARILIIAPSHQLHACAQTN